jgi:hypothetical protein
VEFLLVGASFFPAMKNCAPGFFISSRGGVARGDAPHR